MTKICKLDERIMSERRQETQDKLISSSEMMCMSRRSRTLSVEAYYALWMWVARWLTDWLAHALVYLYMKML